MFAIIGLGNPGKSYSKNRHNAGFLFIDYLISKYGFDPLKKRKNYQYSISKGNLDDSILIKPTTYMNLSGAAVVSVMGFFKITKNNLVIIYDDIALPFGTIRIRERGSDGGHNGIKNISALIGGDDYMRIRIGVGEPSQYGALKNYVLSDFTKEEIDILNSEIFPKIDDSLCLMMNNNIKEAMNKYNERNRNKDN